MSFAADDENDQPESQIDENQQGGTGLAVAKPNQNPQGGASSDSVVSLGAGGTGVVSPGGSSVGSGPSQQEQAAKPSSSGSWTNLQDYLNANSDQAAQMGSQIASNVNNQAQNAQSDISNTASDFQKQVDANTVNANPDQVNQAITDAKSATAANPYSSSDLSNFQSQANASYGGPTDFTKDSNYQQTQNDVNTAQQSLSETGSEAGRDILLQNQYQNTSPTGYNQGEQKLDQLLLEDNPSNTQALTGLQNQWSGIGNALSSAATAGNAAAQNAVQTDQATATAAQKALGDANSSWQTGLNTQLTNAQQAYTKANRLPDALKGEQYLTPDQLAQLGLSSGTHIYDMTPAQLAAYVSSGTTPTMYNTATADQYAQAAALAALGGSGAANFLPSQYSSQAGTAGPATLFNNNQFNTDSAMKGTYFQNQASSAQGQLSQEQAKLQSDEYALQLANQMAPSGNVINVDDGSSGTPEQQNAQAAIAADQAQIAQDQNNWAAIQAILNNTLGSLEQGGH